MIAALIVFLVTYLFVGLTKVPRVPINRPAGALVFRAGVLITGLTILIGILVLAVEVRISHGAAYLPVVSAEAPAAHPTLTVTPAGPKGQPRTYSIVLLCDTPARRVKGLQGFRKLAKGEAALFVFDPPQQVSFWMATLAYPIDIIYVNAAGTVIEVFPARQPGSSEVFSSRDRVRWVVETAADSGVRSGDRIIIKMRGMRP